MAENATKMIEQILDAQGRSLDFSGAIVRDRDTGKSFTEHLADDACHPSTETINALIENGLKPLQTSLNTFLSGDPDDNGTLDRLKELVAAINANKGSIDAILAGGGSGGTGIAFVESAEAAPEYTGKIRMVISDYVPAVEA